MSTLMWERYYEYGIVYKVGKILVFGNKILVFLSM
jgi:hypothetical protein